MGLRQAFDRWRSRPEQPATGRPTPQPSPSVARHRDTAGPTTTAPRRSPSAPSPAPSASSGPGTLVVGSPPAVGDLSDVPPAELPGFYPGAAPAGRPTDGLPQVGPERAAERQLVRQAWAAVADRRDELIRQFYAELFYALGDEALQMFPPTMERQRTEFGRALVQWVSADDPETMSGYLDQLGADHRKFAVEPRHYESVGQALVTAWSRLAGERWSDEVESAVVGSYVRLASRMIDGALRRRHEPASWGATVTAHRRVLPDFAILTVQPDEPYRFSPGQYLTLELATLPKQWRQMSLASAPRADNTFDHYVRSVSDTGVSGALVMHTRVGDRMRLGPPRGGSPLDPAGSRGLLCVCSGTGAAPVVAVVESLLARPDCPEIEVYIGARDAANLIAVDALAKLIAAAGRQDRVRVHGVASDDSSYTGLHGRIDQVVPRLHDWAARDVDVLVAGPDAMMAATLAALTAAGVPGARVRFDQYDLPA